MVTWESTIFGNLQMDSSLITAIYTPQNMKISTKIRPDFKQKPNHHGEGHQNVEGWIQ